MIEPSTLFLLSVPELLTLAHESIQALQPAMVEPEEIVKELDRHFETTSAASSMAALPPEPAPLVAPPIPGPPLAPFRHLYRPALAQTQRIRPRRAI